MDETLNLGKKTFFLYPHSVIQDELIEELLDDEYEVYMLKDHEKALKVLKTFSGSICFINIDEGLKEPEWEEYIQKLMAGPETSSTLVGILSYNSDKGLMQKYLMDLGVQGGYIRLKLGMEESAAIIRKTLEANEARGRRRYVRAICEHDSLSVVNITSLSGSLTGNILDISSVGISCSFQEDPQFNKNTLLKDIQLVLRGARIKTSGVVLGYRDDTVRKYVILFRELAKDGKKKIRKYIYSTLQQSIEVLV
ncbi:MAG: PilZ domain-containing protein [Spirochaetales bacterium]|nr:PilZ domain-containing protein [Spirochaetales bacterium]